MSKGSSLSGAAAFTHALKEYGYGKSMQAGLERIIMEREQAGFLRGINCVFQHMNVVGRLLGRTIHRG